MIHTFYKYHGTGNDFILFDGRGSSFLIPDQHTIARLCDRHFGIGADGIIILRDSNDSDFYMLYFNSDGLEGTMCGNAGRCTAAFARKIGITGEKIRFETIDGIHEAIISHGDYIKLTMNPVDSVRLLSGHYELNTGSPHYVTFREDVNAIDVFKEGSAIRFSSKYAEKGINVNFVSNFQDGIFVRTYERGVENETLSCGTGVVASAICAGIENRTDKKSWNIHTKGGNLKVSFKKTEGGVFRNIIIEGPATFVFEGKVDF